jgi:hypothetical protein
VVPERGGVATHVEPHAAAVAMAGTGLVRREERRRRDVVEVVQMSSRAQVMAKLAGGNGS